MSERGHFRGGGGGGRGGGGDRGGRGGRGGGHRGGNQQGSSQQTEKPKKENILDLNKYINKEVNVKFNGGRESESLPVFTARPNSSER
jgi:U6 snRNA-associated Sm-like protein LSm7